jgi:hypothetical protein
MEPEQKRDDIGYILWKLESLEKFYPSFQSIIEQKQMDDPKDTSVWVTRKIQD